MFNACINKRNLLWEGPTSLQTLLKGLSNLSTRCHLTFLLDAPVLVLVVLQTTLFIIEHSFKSDGEHSVYYFQLPFCWPLGLKTSLVVALGYSKMGNYICYEAYTKYSMYQEFVCIKFNDTQLKWSQIKYIVICHPDSCEYMLMLVCSTCILLNFSCPGCLVKSTLSSTSLFRDYILIRFRLKVTVTMWNHFWLLEIINISIIYLIVRCS